MQEPFLHKLLNFYISMNKISLLVYRGVEIRKYIESVIFVGFTLLEPTLVIIKNKYIAY